MTTVDDPTPSAWLWDVYFAVIAVAVAAAILLGATGAGPDARRIALGAIGAMAVVHLMIGRPLIVREAENRTALLVVLVQIALFGVAIHQVPLSTWLMFAVVPMIFQVVQIRRAIPLVVAVNLLPVAVQYHHEPADIGMDLVVAAISTSAGICMGLWIQGALVQSRERLDLIADLEASRAELARLSHETGIAAERARLAGEIHDTLAQGFTSIITLVQAADPALRDERLALAVRTARENLAESRALVAALSPTALSTGTLPEAVRRQALRFTEETGVPARFRLTGDARDLPTRVEVVLLRAAQEALTNVRRHAGARDAAVLLAYAPDTVRLVVRDDGRGFDASSAGGYGLTGMRSRTAEAGGTLTIHSDAGSGTTIELEIPG